MMYKCAFCSLCYNTSMFWQCPSDACKARRAAEKTEVEARAQKADTYPGGEDQREMDEQERGDDE